MIRCWIGWHSWVLTVLDPEQEPRLDWVWRCARCRAVDVPAAAL